MKKWAKVAIPVIAGLVACGQQEYGRSISIWTRRLVAASACLWTVL